MKLIRQAELHDEDPDGNASIEIQTMNAHTKDVLPLEKLFPFKSKTARVLRTIALFMTQVEYEFQNMSDHRYLE